jgi:DNA uptake protein ComE-like DNA-binding protein
MKSKTWFGTAGAVTVALQAAAGTALGMGLGTLADSGEPVCVCTGSADWPSGHDNLVDINSAPKDWLIWVGIDEGVAVKIIEERPYRSTRDLVTRGILAPATYDKIKDRIIARRV